MKYRHQFSMMEHFLLYSLSLLVIQDVSSATDVTKFEIRSSCFPSSGCQHNDAMIVDPVSNIAHNLNYASFVHVGGLPVQGMTWNQAKQLVEQSTGSSDLVLQQTNTTESGNYVCRCTGVHFARELNIVWFSSTPNFIIQDQQKKLECIFSGSPLPEVSWYKDGKLITNGAQGMYHSEDIKWKKGEKTLRSKLRLPPGQEEQEGFYKCSARNSIPGWSSQTHMTLQMIYECPLPKCPTINSSEIHAKTSSNVNLTCWIDSDDNCPEYLFWYLNDKQLESGEKYEIMKKKTRTKCKDEFILSIFNVTESDKGTYSCHWLCEYEDTTKAAIELKVSSNETDSSILGRFL